MKAISKVFVISKKTTKKGKPMIKVVTIGEDVNERVIPIYNPSSELLDSVGQNIYVQFDVMADNVAGINAIVIKDDSQDDE